jgi:hypothetical protein
VRERLLRTIIVARLDECLVGLAGSGLRRDVGTQVAYHVATRRRQQPPALNWSALLSNSKHWHDKEAGQSVERTASQAETI